VCVCVWEREILKERESTTPTKRRNECEEKRREAEKEKEVRKDDTTKLNKIKNISQQKIYMK
jgi:hypothetical protein